MKILITILISILSAIVVAVLSLLIKPSKRRIYKIVGRDLGERHYIKRNGEKIYIFPKKQYTRISISVLAKIEKGDKFLLKSKKPDSNRQDNIFKPLGGAIKISPKMEEILKTKGEFKSDKETMFSAKNDDARIFMDLENNKIIHKAIYSEPLSYFHNELKREVREELGNISMEQVDKIFDFKQKQPISVQIHYTERDFSFLRRNDYVHHIIFELKVKDWTKLKDLISKNNRLKWISLRDSTNITITSKMLDTKNKFRNFNNK